MPVTTAHRWDAAIDDWQHHLEALGLAESTRARLRKHLRKLAASTTTEPYRLTADDLAAWVDSHDWAPNTRHVYRASLHSFYRWAHNAGRIRTNPMTDQGHPLGRATPAGWIDALAGFREWLKAKGNLHETANRYTEHLKRLARQTGAPTPWDLTAQDLYEWIARHNWARETARSARTALRTFYRWAELRGYVDLSPAEALDPVRTAPAVPRPAPEDVYAAAVATTDRRIRLIVRLAAELGLRRAELAAIHTRDLSQDLGGTWWLHILGKGERPRLVPVPSDLARELRAAGPGYVFPGNDNGHLSPRYVGKLATRVLPTGITLHQLRHRFATRAWAASHDLFAVQRLLGHSNPTTTQRYVAITPDTLSAVVHAVAAQGAAA